MEESRVDTVADDRSVDLSDPKGKLGEKKTIVETDMSKKRRVWVVFAGLSLLVFTLAAGLIIAVGPEQQAMWEIQTGDMYQIAHEQHTYSPSLSGSRLLTSDMDDPTTLVCSVFILGSSRYYIDLVVFMGQIDSKKSQGIFSLLFSDDDQEGHERRGKHIPLVRVHAEAKSGRIIKVEAPYEADHTMVQVAESIASDLLLNRDPQVYLPRGEDHKSIGNQPDSDCVYPETRAGTVFCPQFSLQSDANSTVYVKEYVTEPRKRLESGDSHSEFQAKKATYVSKATGNIEKTCTYGNLTVSLVGNNQYNEQFLAIQQQSTSKFTLKMRALSDSDVELFRYLIERKIHLSDVTSRFFEPNPRNLATQSLSSVPIFNILGFRISLESDLKATPVGLNVTVTLVVDGCARIMLVSGLVGGEVLTAVKKVERLTDEASLTLNQTLSVFAHYSTSGVSTWQSSLSAANLCIWRELTKIEVPISDLELAVNASLAWRKQQISEVVVNYTTIVRKEITLVSTQLQALNDTLVANDTQVSAVNQTLTSYLLIIDEIWARINGLQAEQLNSRNQITSLLQLISSLQDQVYMKEGLQQFEQSLKEMQGNITAWMTALGDISDTLATVLSGMNGDVEHYDYILSTSLPSLQTSLDSAAASLQAQIVDLTVQQSTLTSQLNSLRGTLQSIVSALADIADSLASAVDSDEIANLNQQKADYITEKASVEAQIATVTGQISTLSLDLSNRTNHMQLILDGYENLGYTEAENLRITLQAQKSTFDSLLQGSVPRLRSAMVTELTQLQANLTSSAYKSLNEKAWLAKQIPSLNNTIGKLAWVATSLETLESYTASSLDYMTDLLGAKPTGYFSDMNHILQEISTWRSLLYTRFDALQELIVSILVSVQSDLIGFNLTACGKIDQVHQSLATYVPVQTAYNLKLIADYKGLYNQQYQYAEVTIPAQLEELFKRLKNTIELVTITNTTLIAAKNNHTLPSPLVPALQSQLSNLTMIIESIQNHTFSWRDIFVQSGLLNLSEVFTVQGVAGADCNLTEIERCMEEGLETIRNSVLGDSETIRNQTNALISVFVDIDQLPAVRLTQSTTFLNFSEVAESLRVILSLFNSTDSQLWALESQLQQNVTNMQGYISLKNQSVDTAVNQLAGVMASIEDMQTRYLVTFAVPNVIAKPGVSMGFLNQTSILVGTLTVSPLIRLYEAQFSSSLSLTQSLISNHTHYINTYLSSFTSPLIVYAYNSSEASFVLGPICTPIGCVFFAANMSLNVEMMVGTGFNGEGFYAIMSPKTVGKFEGVGVVSIGSTKIEAGLSVVSPITPSYRIGVHNQSATYFVDGSVSSGYSGSLHLLVTDYDKYVDGSCWCVKDGKVYRKLCLSWQRIHFNPSYLLWRKSFSTATSKVTVANLTLEMV